MAQRVKREVTEQVLEDPGPGRRPHHDEIGLPLGRVLQQRSARLFHIRGDGRLESEQALARDQEFQKTKGQMTLFELEDPDAWKSTQSVFFAKPIV